MQFLNSFIAFMQGHGAEILAFVAGLLIELPKLIPSLANNAIYKAINGVVEFLSNLFKKKA